MKNNEKTVCIVGLGYVGYPLACAFASHIKTIGFDINKNRIASLNEQNVSNLQLTTDPIAIQQSDYVCICVPTPVNNSKTPDLSYIISAAELIGQNLKKGTIIILESTVYPGLTEELLIPTLEKKSGYLCGTDFFVGYSPERINPGDNSHDLKHITKIVSGIDEKTTNELESLYSLITTVYKAESIKVAEAAKVIENIQRDLNIALINELSIIFSRLNIDTYAVLNAASTKWNFQNFLPGLVGGHCIPVDPYYLVYKSEQVGYHPQVILSGRNINDYMPKYVAELTIEALNDAGRQIKGSNVVIAGLTYKGDVPDIRESPVPEIIKELKRFHINIFGYDPLLEEDTIKKLGLIPIQCINNCPDGIIMAANHKEFSSLSLSYLKSMMSLNPVLIDVRRQYSPNEAKKLGFEYRTL